MPAFLILQVISFLPESLLAIHSHIALPGKGIALEAWAHGDIGEGVVAAAALNGDTGSLGTDCRG